MSLSLISLVYAVPLVLLMAAVAAVIVWVIVRLARNPVNSPSGQRASVASSAGRQGHTAWGSPAGQWNAHVRRDGHLDPLSGFGTLTLAGGMLTFVPDGTQTPAWSVPSVAFGVWSNFVLANSDLTIDSQDTGKLKLTVSHENINRFSRNDFKTMRERDTSGEFIELMRASGATILS